MEWTTVAARAVLGVVFLVAGATKVASPGRWRSQAAAMGAGPRLAATVPWWEVVVGALLVAGVAAPWPALAALVTLVAFTAQIGRLLARGERPVCACFGALSQAPIGASAVARNTVLALVAVLAVLGDA